MFYQPRALNSYKFHWFRALFMTLCLTTGAHTQFENSVENVIFYSLNQDNEKEWLKNN